MFNKASLVILISATRAARFLVILAARFLELLTSHLKQCAQYQYSEFSKMRSTLKSTPLIECQSSFVTIPRSLQRISSQSHSSYKSIKRMWGGAAQV